MVFLLCKRELKIMSKYNQCNLAQYSYIYAWYISKIIHKGLFLIGHNCFIKESKKKIITYTFLVIKKHNSLV